MASNLRRLLPSLIEASNTKQGLRSGLSTLSPSVSGGWRSLCSSGKPETQTGPKEAQEVVPPPKAESGKEDEVEDDDDLNEEGVYVNKETGEVGGPRGPEPTRFGDWERKGRCSDF